MGLANDVCRCHANGCKERNDCKRWLFRLSDGERVVHSLSLFSPSDTGDCINKISAAEDYNWSSKRSKIRKAAQEYLESDSNEDGIDHA